MQVLHEAHADGSNDGIGDALRVGRPEAVLAARVAAKAPHSRAYIVGFEPES